MHPSAPFTRPLLARWNGSAWSLQSTPALNGDAQFDGIDSDSANNAWAVGHAGTGGLIERWNGSAWSVVSSPIPAGATGAGRAA